MKIPKAKQVKVEPNKEFDKFIVDISNKPTEEAKMLWENYRSKLNALASNERTITTSAKQLRQISCTLYKEKLEKALEQEDVQTITPPTFSIETLKSINHVEEVFMENNVLVIITKEITHKTYTSRNNSWTANWEWTIPSYRIEYNTRNRALGRFERELEERYTEVPSVASLGYLIKLNNQKDIDNLEHTENILGNEILHSNRAGKTISPYLSSDTEYTESGYTDVCYGSSSSMQAIHISKNEILPHLHNLITTLTTTDETGRGYSSWISKIIREEIIKRSLELKKKAGIEECMIRLTSNAGKTETQLIIQPSTDEGFTNTLQLKLNTKGNTNLKKDISKQKYHLVETDNFQITGVQCEPSDNLNKAGKIISINIVVKAYAENESIEQACPAEIKMEETDLKNIAKITTPKGDFTFAKFNSLMKNPYETSTTI